MARRALGTLFSKPRESKVEVVQIQAVFLKSRPEDAVDD
jgi:hypothetical protein